MFPMDKLELPKRKLIAGISIIPIFFALAFLWFIAPPLSFPSQSIFTVSDGVSLSTLANKLREEKVIRSPFWFRTAAIMLGGERDMKAGQYHLERPQGVFTLAWRIFHGDYGVEAVRITIPEGFNVMRIAALFDERFEFFDSEKFLADAPEGYLFPDTYFFPVTATASSVTKLMRENFARKVASIREEIDSSDKSFEEIIIMASIIESEARFKEDREIVSGILWKRLELGIPLQVDASFIYVNGKTTKDLTLNDLKIDSPFNTYLYRGLPPAPISNPGIESILAAINPTSTPYLYFLTGDNGQMYYSRTHEEHSQKKRLYIRR